MERTGVALEVEYSAVFMRYVCSQCDWCILDTELTDIEASKALLRHVYETEHTPAGTVEALQRPPTGMTIEPDC